MTCNSFAQLAAFAALRPSASEWISLLATFDASDALGRLASNQKALEGVARESYRHANGFSKIVLAKEAGVTVRLHVWQQESELPPEARERIHNHKWDFASRVLIGALYYENFAVSNGGDELLRYVSPKRREQEGYILEPKGRVGVTLEGAGRMTAGTTYFTDGRGLHRVYPSQDGTVATLLLQTPHRYKEYEVLSPFEILDAEHVETRALTCHELEFTLRVVLGAS